MLPVETPFKIYTGRDGKPINNGYVYFGVANQNPITSPITVYWDAAGTQPAAQPIRTENGYIMRAGSPANVFCSVSYSELVQDSRRRQVFFARSSDDFSIASSVLAFILGLASSVGSTLIGFIQAGVGAVALTLQTKNRQIKDIEDYGGGTGKTAAENTAALLAAFADSPHVTASAGTYAFTAGQNYAAKGRKFIGKGNVIMDFSAGSGIGFKIDAGGAGATIRDMTLENIIFKGGPAITDIFYSRGIVSSSFKNLQAREGTATGFKLLFSVLNNYENCKVSNDDTAMTTTPTRSFYLDNDGTSGNHTQANTFVNCDASGKGATSLSFGWTLVDASLNTWHGGTAESLYMGVQIQDDKCRNNSWYGFDLEGNVVSDIEIRGFANAFYTSSANSVTSSYTVNNVSGVDALFSGGYMRAVFLNSGSSNTTFLGTHFEDNAALGITGTGSYKAYGITEGNGYTTSAAQKDVLGATSTGVSYVASQGVTPSVVMTKNETIITGQMCNLQANFAFTSAGTAANAILVDFPAGFTAKASAVGMPVGKFTFNKAGVNTSGVVVLQSQLQFSFIVNGGSSLFGINPATTIANTDVLSFSAFIPLQ